MPRLGKVDEGRRDKAEVCKIKARVAERVQVLQPLADGASESGEERSLNTTIARVLEFYDSMVLP